MSALVEGPGAEGMSAAPANDPAPSLLPEMLTAEETALYLPFLG